MANNCWNWISFNGEVGELIEKFEKFNDISNTVEAYQSLFPKGYDVPSGETLLFENPKWFDTQIDYTEEKDSLTVSGDSAWSPPCRLVQLLCKAYGITARIEFEECGCDFGGYEEVNEEGEVVESLETTYKEWRYINEGIEGMANELYYYEEEEDREAFLEEVKAFMSEEDYNELINN